MIPEYKESELIIRLINSDEEAFCHLYAKYHQKLYLFALKYLKSGDLAEDISQDVFTLIWKNRNFLDPNASFKSYLYTITRNRILNLIRENSRKQFLDDLILSEAIDADSDTFEKVTATELENIIEQALCNLTDRQKEIYDLSRNQGLTHQQIAQKLEISAGTVNEHITNALKSIQNHLNKYYGIYIAFFILTQLNS